jgi:hypothetical protein
MLLRRLLHDRLSLNMMVHIAQPYQRALWPTCLEMFREELAILARSRFRHRRGFWLNLADHYLARERGAAVFSYEPSDVVVWRSLVFANPALPKARLRGAARSGIKFLCLNDGLDTSGGDWRRFIEEALSEALDAPSRWEKACAASAPPAPKASAPEGAYRRPAPCTCSSASRRCFSTFSSSVSCLILACT